MRSSDRAVPSGDVRVFQQIQCFGKATGAEADGFHELVATGLAQPRGHLMQAELVRLGGMPRQIEAAGAVLLGAHAVFPVVAGDEVAAGVADGGGAQVLDQVDYVLPEPLFVGGGMPRLVDAGVYAASQMLDE